jgi:putative ABC transport system substrate-binding protein
MLSIRRRDFISLLGSAAAWPITARGQQVKLPTIGFLGGGVPAAQRVWADTFVRRLNELGWIEGRTVRIEYRWGESHPERYAEIAAEFVQLKVDVILAGGTEPAAAAKQATASIPIVFPTAGDPIGSHLVASLARPGGNVTGLSNQGSDLGAKRLGILREVVPGLRRLAVMVNTDYSGGVTERIEIDAGARTLGLEVVPLPIRRVDDITPAFEGLKERADALAATTGIRRSSRADVLWGKFSGLALARRRVCRQDFARRKARGSSGRAADQVRPRHQPDHRQGNRHHHPTYGARPRR